MANSSDLVFKDLPVGRPTDLVFGATSSIPGSTLDISTELGGVEVSLFVMPPAMTSISTDLGGVTFAAAVIYDNRVTPWLDARVASPMDAGVPFTHDQDTGWGISDTKRDGKDMPWADGARRDVGTESAHQTSLPNTVRTSALWDTANHRNRDSTSAHQTAVAHAIGGTQYWALADRVARAFDASNQTGIFHELVKLARHQVGTPALLIMGSRSGASLHYTGLGFLTAPWRQAGVPYPGVHRPPVIPPVGPPTYWWGADLVFQCPRLAFPYLVFGGTTPCDGPSTSAPLFILPARYYMAIHTIQAQRLPDLVEIPIFDATVAADESSFCWTLSATGPSDLFALLAPVDGLPAQLQVTMDGIVFVFAVDSVSRKGEFVKSGATISGRSVTSLIGDKYMRATTHTNTEARMAQQLALSALQDSGVDLDWGLTDWLVPTAAWSHQGTPLAAVQTIAQAAGGYLQSHRSASTLLVRHPYSQRAGDNPGAPWGWMTGPADIELAPDAIITEGVDRNDGPDINAVYVSGTTQGLLALVKRSGTAADKLAAMVTDPLITHTIAARQRGLSILGLAGPQYNVTLDLPVLTGSGQPGVVDVGQLVQINTATPWRGRVRAVSVSAKRPSLRQSITLERHL